MGERSMKMRTSKLTQIAGVAGIFGIAGLVLLASGCSRAEPGTYATPEEAVQALGELVGSGDDKRAEEMFGPGCMDLFRSGDPVADKQEAERVKALIAEKVGIGDVDGTARVAVLGNDEWPFPIPIVPAGKRWRFDTAAGREELLNRRIGENELYTLASLHAYVDAQFEYHATGHDGLAPAFAQRVRSTEGKQDGLFWETAEDEELSPLGDLLAEAEAIVP